MIVGKRFTWGHLPKTGGDATYAMLRASGVPAQMSLETERSKHSPFGTHLDPGGARLYAVNIRRLPSWALSVMRHCQLFGWFPPRAGPHIVTIDELVRDRWADGWLATLTNRGTVTIDRFLRMECLAEDLTEFLDEVAPVPLKRALARSGRLAAVPRVNTMAYDHDVPGAFTHGQVRALYRRNPTWAAIEARVYQDVLR